MDPRTRKLAGWVIVAVGLVVAAVGALADQLGLGGEGPDQFGGKQVAALIVGLVIALAGLALVFWPRGSTEPGAGAPTGPTT
jgi:hypothetical protein